MMKMKRMKKRSVTNIKILRLRKCVRPAWRRISVSHLPRIVIDCSRSDLRVDDCDGETRVSDIWKSREAPGREPGQSVEECLAVVRCQLVGPATPDRFCVSIVTAGWRLQQQWRCHQRQELCTSSCSRWRLQASRESDAVDRHPRNSAEDVVAQEPAAMVGGRGGNTRSDCWVA